MGFTAVHADWGRLDASLDDLGCGRAWEDVHRVKGLQLACPECGGPRCHHPGCCAPDALHRIQAPVMVWLL